MIRLTLPLPPTANRYWRHVKGRVLLSKEAREYRDACQLAAVAQYGGELLDDRVRVRVDVYMDLRGDLDNRLKQLFDALEGTVLVNDRQVWDFRAVRHLDRERPRVEVEVGGLMETAPPATRSPDPESAARHDPTT